MNTRPTHVAVVVVVIAAILFVARPADGVASAHGSAVASTYGSSPRIGTKCCEWPRPSAPGQWLHR